MKPSIVKKIDLDFTCIEIHEHYLISQIKEGLVFEQHHLDKFFEIFDTYFAGKAFVSIADRKNDYTINPNLLRDSRYDNLLGIGVVCYSKSSYETALFEKSFFKGPFEVFYSMQEAIEWAAGLIEAYKKKADL
jgi:hypothetical protein